MTPSASAAAVPAVQRRADEQAGTLAPSRPAGRAQPRTAPRVPRRRSGAAQPARPAHRGAGIGAMALGLGEAVGSLSRHRLLDRLIGGRVWIALVAFALIGIVTLQLGLLKLNGGIGRALEHEALLQRENAALSIEDSELAARDPVEARAARIGMEFAPLRALRFLAVRPGIDSARAATSLTSGGQFAGGASQGGGATTAAGSATESANASTAAEAPASEASATTPRSSESTAGSSPQASAPSAESTTAPSRAETPSTSEPAGAGETEATPAGGTRAGSPGG